MEKEYEVMVSFNWGARAKRILEAAGHDVEGPFRGCTTETLFVLVYGEVDLQMLLWDHGFGWVHIEEIDAETA